MLFVKWFLKISVNAIGHNDVEYDIAFKTITYISNPTDRT